MKACIYCKHGRNNGNQCAAPQLKRGPGEALGSGPLRERFSSPFQENLYRQMEARLGTPLCGREGLWYVGIVPDGFIREAVFEGEYVLYVNRETMERRRVYENGDVWVWTMKDPWYRKLEGG